MVQLRVEDSGQSVWIDLYETEPIKLTLSIEDITNADARSVFSRTFRVPNTGNNNKFFKHAFEIEGIDYDVTVKKPATILVDGAEFRSGHIRLQKIYKNRMDSKIDYEIVFLGETRDFASALGDKTLGDLDLSEYNHDLSYANVTDSWQAYPQGAYNPVTGVGDGLFNGDILYPLVDFGEIEGQERFRYTLNTSDGGFNHPQNAVAASRFKPMIRAKALWDKIFEEAGFTYTSQIANSGQFTQLYISAFGNEPGQPTDTGTANELDVAFSADYQLSGTEILEWDVENLDPSNNYNPATGKYTVPNTGNYTINARVQGVTRGEASGGVVYVRLRKGPLTADILDSDTNTIPFNSQTNWTSSLTYSGTLTAGDTIYIEVEEAGDVSNTLIYNSTNSYFRIPQAAGPIGIATLLDNDYKQIDFIKDMLTKFRLVMAYDKNDPKNFIVEPWVNYIATGDLYDWTDKVDHSKDMMIEPLFFTI